MAKIVHGDKEVEVADGERIQNACEDLDVPFACCDGMCGSCRVEVLEGEKNLSPPNDKEKDIGFGGKTRLACQCVIKNGTVKIDF